MENNEYTNLILDEVRKYLSYSVLQHNENLENIKQQLETSKMIEACEIKVESFDKLQNKTLKEKDLRKIVKKALAIKNVLLIRSVDCDKCEILIAVAEHSQASIELIQEIKEHISNEIKYKYVQELSLNKINEIISKKKETSQQLKHNIEKASEELSTSPSLALLD